MEFQKEKEAILFNLVKLGLWEQAEFYCTEIGYGLVITRLDLTNGLDVSWKQPGSLFTLFAILS